MSGLKNPKLVVLTLIALIGVSSCQKNDNSTPTTTDRDKFLGTWHVSSYGTVFHQQNWDMIVNASVTAPDQILIKDFDQQSGTTTYGTVSGNNFSITTQVIGKET